MRKKRPEKFYPTPVEALMIARKRIDLMRREYAQGKVSPGGILAVLCDLCTALEEGPMKKPRRQTWEPEQ